jgi:hypothetical protein
VTGQPSLSLAGPDSRLSGNATAGKDRIFPLTLHNTGTAPARAVKLDATLDESCLGTLGLENQSLPSRLRKGDG